MHLRIKGKGDKIRYIPLHPMALRLIGEYLEMAKHGGGQDAVDLDGPLFRPVKNNRTGTLNKHLDPGSIYKNVIAKYGRETGINIEVIGLCVHSMRATAATNALSNEADIAKVQEWLGHANVSNHPPLRPAQEQARGFSDISCEILKSDDRKINHHRLTHLRWSKFTPPAAISFANA